MSLNTCVLGWVGAMLAIGSPSAGGQSLTPISGFERSSVNAQVFEPRGPVPETAPPAEFQPDSAPGAGPGEQGMDATQPDSVPVETSGSPGAFLSDLGTTFAPKALRVRLGLRFRTEYNSNVTVSGGAGRGSSAGPETSEESFQASEEADDIILTASVDITVFTQFAGGSSLGLSLELGYEQYLLNPEFSGPIINSSAPGGLAFRFATGDVQWTVFDQFSFSNNAADEPELSGVTNFSRFSNTAGVEAAWSPSEFLLLQAQYAHTNTSTSTSESAARDQTSDSFQLTATYPLNPLLHLGLTGSVSFTEQTRSDEGDTSTTTANSAGSEGEYAIYGIGPFLRGKITNATSILLIGGVQMMDSGDTADQTEGGDESGGGGESFYGKIELKNQLTTFYQHSLSIGRDTRIGLLSDTVTTDFLRYSNSLPLGNRAQLSGKLFLEQSEQSGGAVSDSFRRTGGGVTLRFPLRPTISTAVGWQYTRKDSDREDRSYSQHRVFASVSWYF